MTTIGIVQEQHGDRARLFMQWKKMDWPLLVDVANELEVKAVPITLFIDEAGIVQAVNPNPKQIEAFAEVPPPRSMPMVPLRKSVDIDELRARALAGHAIDQRILGLELFKWHGHAALSEAIHAFAAAARSEPDHGLIWFQRGVAQRARFDSDERQPGDFQAAVDSWHTALQLDPNQYIWRRRIQQYGPRLDKPYPFYDWVPTARAEIVARGDTPITLVVEPGGAEFAQPSRTFESTADLTQPDANGLVHLDNAAKPYVITETVVVPATSDERTTYRIHVLLRPNATIDAHWNNESEPLAVWLNVPEAWAVRQAMHIVPNPTARATSTELRQVEFELSLPGNHEGTGEINGYALYNVCEGRDGTCLYRRADFNVIVRKK